jgi:hypothetical protein
MDKIQTALKLFKILVGQFQHYLKMQAQLNNLPPPTELPEDWDELLKEPVVLGEAGDDGE